MKFKPSDIQIEEIFIAITVVVFMKLALLGITYQESLGALVLLLSLLAAKVIYYKFPKRPDLYSEMSLLQQTMNEYITKVEGLESDVTGLKFNGMKR